MPVEEGTKKTAWAEENGGIKGGKGSRGYVASFLVALRTDCAPLKKTYKDREVEKRRGERGRAEGGIERAIRQRRNYFTTLLVNDQEAGKERSRKLKEVKECAVLLH